MALCGSLFGLQIVLEKSWVPYTLERAMAAEITQISIVITAILNVTIHSVPYYAVLIFFLIYNGYLHSNRWIPLVLSLPVIVAFFQADLSQNWVDKQFIIYWGFLYLMTALWLAVRCIWLERDGRQRLHHAAIALIFIIPVAALNVYQIASFPLSDQLITLIPYLCVVGLAFSSILYLRDAFLGVQRKSVQTVHAGTALIHHSLKNSISKIKLNALNIRRSIHKGKYEEIETYVSNLLKTHEAMNETLSVIAHAVSNKMEPQMEVADISDLLDEVLEAVEAYPHIKVEKQYESLSWWLDPIMMKECWHNICINAVDAMGERGVFRVAVVHRKSTVQISFRDTGPGMSSLEVQNIFEPFYSTKHRTGRNFGMGMYQVKKVVAAHKGMIEVKSKPGQGTTVTMILRKGRKTP
ncbi:sensor histidine kinase [Paenibacillus chungangensis]|uniref:histidine kinase n=1 Tax=Paenibacillus chungangensis TaxID=696535 RepID=A0ABW3HNN8_9BACL